MIQVNGLTGGHRVRSYCQQRQKQNINQPPNLKSLEPTPRSRRGCSRARQARRGSILSRWADPETTIMGGLSILVELNEKPMGHIRHRCSCNGRLGPLQAAWAMGRVRPIIHDPIAGGRIIESDQHVPSSFSWCHRSSAHSSRWLALALGANRR